jgi:hypothetical protein
VLPKLYSRSEPSARSRGVSTFQILSKPQKRPVPRTIFGGEFESFAESAQFGRRKIEKIETKKKRTRKTKRKKKRRRTEKGKPVFELLRRGKMR